MGYSEHSFMPTEPIRQEAQLESDLLNFADTTFSDVSLQVTFTRLLLSEFDVVHAQALQLKSIAGSIGALKTVADSFPGFAPANMIAVAHAQAEVIVGQLANVDDYESKATNVLWCEYPAYIVSTVVMCLLQGA